ncbi:unnamed protein product [Cladocopium goreaui]|uniref:Uncharacterized protein n=1 Tax=Cladocopium goreaui TaxID=2562237 RepID=A0A9P1FNK8_9DINO|nr:unnamed protein product [Cladocopium goreaui]
MEVIQVAYMWRVARRAVDLPDVDPLAEPSPVVTAPSSSASSGKKVKASNVLDQMDDTEIVAMTRQELNQAYQFHIEETGAEPPHDCDPTVEQIAAMRDRTITRQEAPYADFSILTPFGKTMQRQLKTRSWVFQQDGSFRALDVPGPPSLEAWKSCWKVYRSILFMLRYPSTASGLAPKKVVTSASLEEYFERIVKLAADFPETWHLIMRAEDKCRSEMLERYRRQLTKAALEGRLPMNLDFDPNQPWIGVFTYAARNSEFWDEQVVKPSTIFIARGGRHMTSEKAERVHIPEEAQAALDNVKGMKPELGKSPKPKSPKKGKGPKRALEETSESPPAAKTKKKDTEHPRKWGNLFVTTADGVEICFKNAKGKPGTCFGGLSREIAEVCGGLVHVLEPLDQHGGWDILTDDGFAQAKELVSKADHAHLAFPCRSFSTARRSDQHGDVPVIRSSEKPDGWGSPLAVEGNLILERAIILAFLLLDKGSTFSMENPENSYAWLVSFIQRLKRVVGVIFSGLDQCPFGARTQKPTGILGNAAWMTSINTRCHQVRPHAHMEGGLQGKTWDPITNTWVWKTSKAAEYPQGLCHAWALALKGWLTSKEGYQFMACRTLVKVSPFQMVRLDMVGSRLDKAVTQMEPLDASSSRQRLSKRAVREEENLQAIGGLRDPRRAVARSLKLRRVGERIRTVLDRCYSVQDLLSFEKAVGMGAELVYRCRREMAAEFNVSCTFVSVADYQTDLLESLLQEAEDKDAKVLPGWLRHGVPLGISQPIENTNIFPATDDVSAAIKASQTIGQLLEDWSGKALNYRSFYEAGQKAQSELDRLVTDGRADCVDTWEQVVSMVGTDAKLTQLACIIKNKEGKEKVRLVVDMRRSGINGTMTLLERVVLPRIPDVAKSCDELLKTSNPDDQLEFFVCDFSDAFYTLKLHDSERKWVVCKGLDSRLGRQCFGRLFMQQSFNQLLGRSGIPLGGVKRAREELGLNGVSNSALGTPSSVETPALSSHVPSLATGTSFSAGNNEAPASSNDWIFVPVTSSLGPKFAEKADPVNASQVLRVVDMVGAHSSSSRLAGGSFAVEHAEAGVVIEAARRHRPKGPLLPDPRRASKGSVSQALRIAGNERDANRALEVFNDAMYAPQTTATKNALRNTWCLISNQLGLEAFPLSTEKIVKAEEIPEELLQDIWTQGKFIEGRANWPELRHEAWVVAISFLLRETELAGLRLSQTDTLIDIRKKQVSLHLPVSKADPVGRGCRRTLSCICNSHRCFKCPFCAVMSLVRNQVIRTGVQQTEPKAEEIPLVASIGSPWETIKKEAVIEALKGDAQSLVDDRPPLKHRICVERVTGHSFRRTGAKMLARSGISIDLIQFMARHSSSAILGYVEEAAEESPAISTRLQDHLDLRSLINSALKDCNDLKESMEKVNARLNEGTVGTPIALTREHVYEAFDRWSRPEVVYNIHTSKLHSTSGNCFRNSPKDWTTSCGWKWITSGRDARAVLERNDLPSDFTICAKCHPKIPQWVFGNNIRYATSWTLVALRPDGLWSVAHLVRSYNIPLIVGCGFVVYLCLFLHR